MQPFFVFPLPACRKVRSFAVEKANVMMEKNRMKPLTKAEMDVMNVLWDASHALTVNEIVDGYDEPKPAYTTVATFLKILEAKGYVEHKRREETGRTFYYSPMLSREKYITHILKDVKDTLFGSSAKRFCSFLIQNEELSDEDLQEILELIDPPTPFRRRELEECE